MNSYIFVSGGVVSGCGKGVAASAIALLLKMRGETVQYLKFDPYLNIDASLLSPYEHGEVWLGDDPKSECDLDLGHVYRIAGIDVGYKNIFTSGKLYQQILEEERDGKFIGKTIQTIPHFTDLIQSKIEGFNESCTVLVVEIGGTVGDIESAPFFEAIRQFKLKKGHDRVLLVHVAPILTIADEMKTKPLQKSIIELQGFGLHPDLLLCRSSKEITDKLNDKISSLTGVNKTCIFPAYDAECIYKVPLLFYDSQIDDLIADRLKLKRNGVRINKWRDLVEKYTSSELAEVNLAIIGKYVKMQDSYLSLKEAVYHAGVANNVKVNIRWIEAERLEEYSTLRGLSKYFDDVHAVIVPGGFDNRGVEGKIKAIQYVRERKIPFLGICLGLQCAVIEFARNVCGMEKATSEEFDPQGEQLVVHYVEGQKGLRQKGGTLRLGAYECNLLKNSLAHNIYGRKTVSERHRHRYEVNDRYVSALGERGLVVSGTNPETNLVEVMELDRKLHPFFLGTQAHPEFRSKLDTPHPLFKGLIAQAVEYKNRSSVVEAENARID